MSRPSVKASTSPSTQSAPTTCKSPPGRGLPGGRAHNYGLGHIPGNVPTVEGLQRKLEPLSFCLLLSCATKKAIAISDCRRRNIDHNEKQTGRSSCVWKADAIAAKCATWPKVIR